jgi:hypothetical protein
MQRYSRYGWWSVPFVIMILLAVVFRRSGADAVHARSIDDWSIVELTEQLKLTGVKVRLRSTQQNGVVGQTAFLIFTEKDWRSLNTLKKDSKHIHEWRGVLFCERVGESDSTHLTTQWGDHCLAVGPFLFYGDAEHLRQVRDALIPFAPTAVL